MLCPQCGREAECDMVDNGVGMQQCGPYGCEPCGWVQPDPCELLVECASAKEPVCCREPLDSRGACSGCGLSAKVRALITQADASWTEADYIELALAALDQAGASVSLQRRVNEWVDDELAERDVRDVNRAYMEDA